MVESFEGWVGFGPGLHVYFACDEMWYAWLTLYAHTWELFSGQPPDFRSVACHDAASCNGILSLETDGSRHLHLRGRILAKRAPK